uniref:Putative secreted protein n=1 Tax=Anopheles darlingi TaxID=43151 RepID=A0A2M4D828_ANODA
MAAVSLRFMLFMLVLMNLVRSGKHSAFGGRSKIGNHSDLCRFSGPFSGSLQVNKDDSSVFTITAVNRNLILRLIRCKYQRHFALVYGTITFQVMKVQNMLRVHS